MALDFPDAPTNGQYYRGFVYNNVPGAWRVTDPIPSVDTPAAVSGTTGSPTVSSGVTIGDFTYDIYTFKTDGTITFGGSGFADLLCVGGGGGGGRANTNGGSGAGGAGGVIDLSPYVYAGTEQIIVGAGGASQEDGSPSLAFNFGAIGGGRGAKEVGETPAFNGGSGGGGGTDTSPYAPGLGIIGQGNDGGYGYSGGTEAQDAGGGGGGAGAVGGAGSNNLGGTGGAGAISTIITTTLATSLAVGEVSGSDVYFGGGGGGGCRTSGGAGAIGGGGAGGSGTGTNGTANTGGGGGGASTSSATVYGGAGGSGVVIVRVKV
jgi:hypothetical protein